MKFNKNQGGFSAVEALLILVVIGLVGFVGWYVWHNKQAAVRNTTAQTSGTKPATSKASPTQKLITMPQWGVEAAYSGELQLSYKITDNDAVFSSKPLTDLYAGCEGFAGTIRRYDMAGLQKLGQDGPFGAPGVTTKIIGNYGYVFVHAQSECAGSATDSAFVAQKTRIDSELTSANDAVKSLVEHLKVDSCASEPELSAPCAKKEGVY